jgi:hypothetical protein
MAQTTRFDARRCLFGVSLMYAFIKGSIIPKHPKIAGLMGISSQNENVEKLLNGTRFTKKMSTDHNRKSEIEKSNGDVTSGLPHPY